MLDQEHGVEACIGLSVHTSERGSAAVSPMERHVQAAAHGGSPHHHMLPQQAADTHAGQLQVLGPECPPNLDWPAPVGAHSNPLGLECGQSTSCPTSGKRPRGASTGGSQTVEDSTLQREWCLYKKGQELAFSLPCEDMEMVAISEPGRGTYSEPWEISCPVCSILLGQPELTKTCGTH